MPLFKIWGQTVFFVHIPKTGGSSISRFLGQHCTAGLIMNRNRFLCCSAQHFHAELYTRLLPSEFYEYSFTIIRNPYDRIISEYLYRTKGRKEIISFSWWVRFYLWRSRHDACVLDNHLRPQVDFLSSNLDIFRYEDGIVDVISKLCERLRLPEPERAPHLKKAERKLLAIDQRSLERIRRHYADDFRELGYSDDPAEILEGSAIAHPN